ncbi:zincin-like metallopeptidase domain-containing protein [Bacteroides acidifaciens]|uniref:zincin-like metallopeptidase domain-containing protein n=1 Tax=Bacteroides acidifaciens TaxID=85831 RepID=UPI002149A389|nr:zincin-like metallopeptidase domain-containing protein [Bacteroides acidifaciens]MCR2007733.1 zincin-like metallopeptidase domain-containing protein [Bacteroides acidifaciens]
MNAAGRNLPKFYPKGITVSPFNALVLGMHTDQSGYTTGLYTMFSDAKQRGEAILQQEHGVPFNWYKWDQYVNRHNSEDTLSREAYQALPEEQQKLYKGVRQREIIILFNIDQTTLPMTDAEKYRDLQQRFGSRADRGYLKSEERQLRSTVNQFVAQIRTHLIPVRKNAAGMAHFDTAKDAVYMPEPKQFEHYEDYVQELMRQVASSTGHAQRLAREGMVMKGGKAPSEDAVHYERLVAELVSGVKMMELGLPARLADDSLPLVEHWTRELQENPHYIEAIESDVNNALGVIRRAEQGEKVEYATLRTQRQTSEMQERQGPQVDARESAILVDILRTGGMAIDSRNFPSSEARNAFLEKFDLGYYEQKKNEALSMVTDEDTDVVEIAYTEALTYGTKIATACREYLPAEWNTKGSYRIADELKSVPDRSTKEMVVVRDRQTGIVDVVLPAGATTGGHVVLSATDRRPFYLTPDEVMPVQERSGQQARIVAHNLPGFSKQQIAGALMKQGASYVRFFNKDGLLGYRPDDSYFKDKEVFTAKLNNKELQVQATLDVEEAVDKATHVQFEHIQMLRDDNNRWALYLRPTEGEAFSIYPDKEDLNRFFSAVKQNEQKSAQEVRMELTQKYYALGTDRPELRQDLFGTAPADVDLSLIQRANIFRAKDDKFLCVPQIKGMGKIEAREVSRQQWQRLWIAEDMAGYKTKLAATLFADVLKQAQEAKLAENRRETSEMKNEGKELTDWKIFEELKDKYKDAVLLFRDHDRYESYKEDADRVANVLGISVSERDGGIHAVSFPNSDLDKHLPKLVRSGMRVGICDKLPRVPVSALDTPIENEQRPTRRM